MMLTDENGECIETASNLKAKFEALRLLEEAENKKQEQQPAKKFVPKRFKVRNTSYGSCQEVIVSVVFMRDTIRIILFSDH